VRILVIRRDNIGDLVCTTPLIAGLRKRYPDAHIAALVNSYNAAVLDGNPDLNAVHVYTKLKHRLGNQSALGIILARFRMLRELRREPFDIIILASAIFNPHGLRFARQLRRRDVVGFSNGSEPGARHITVKVPIKDYSHLHEVQVLALLAHAIDVPDAEGSLRIFPKERCVREWEARLPELRAQARPWVAVHISARERERQWPVEKWNDVIAQLTATGVGVVLIWAPGPESDPRHPGDDEKASRVLAAAKDNPLVRAAPTTTLDDLIAVLRLCHAFVGADGGAMHIAAALGLPMAALFEGVVLKKYRWYPWHVPHELVASETRDITAISAAQLTEAWQRLTSRVALAASTRAAIPLAARAHE
jgi:ADP-heptose:LPS heptosyltransferase